jgi:hypothetical protein
MMREGIKARRRTAALAPILVALALAGCGGSGSSEPSTIAFKSPAVQADGAIRSNVFCGLGSLWLPLEWGAAPDGTKELAIYMGRFKYKKVEGGRKLVVPFANLIWHINPNLRRNGANYLPEEAAWSRAGPVSCPRKDGQNILQVLFALDEVKDQRNVGMKEAIQLTEEALARRKAGTMVNSKSPAKLMEDTAGIGQFVATYDP